MYKQKHILIFPFDECSCKNGLIYFNVDEMLLEIVNEYKHMLSLAKVWRQWFGFVASDSIICTGFNCSTATALPDVRFASHGNDENF